MIYINEFGQPVGEPVPNWKPCLLPEPVTLTGRTCLIEQLDVAKHAKDLYDAYSHEDGRLWTYMFNEPFANFDEYCKFAEESAKSTDPRHYAVIDLSTGKAV